MRRWCWAVAVLVLAVSCGRVPPSYGGQATFRQQAGKDTVWLTMRPWPARSLTTSSLSVRVVRPDGQPARGVQLGINLSMPTMQMGRTRLNPVREGPGRWRAQGVFSMNGAWRVTVKVRGGGGGEARFVFQVQ